MCDNGEMIFDPIYITYGLVGFVVILIILIIRLEIRVKKLLTGKNGKSLEDSIVSAHQNLSKLNDFQREAISHFIDVERRLNRSVQAVETIRFNPFKGDGVGGTQSFSTAFINANGDGVVISSLYSRDRVSVFSKPIIKFESNFGLTEEEKSVVNNSKDILK
ncbi:MAG: DUF4446 family protein [Minisyncoccia bacterium]